jgi:hypothetical protein
MSSVALVMANSPDLLSVLIEQRVALRMLLQLLGWVCGYKMTRLSPARINIHHELDGISCGLLLSRVSLKLGVKRGNSVVEVAE